MNRVQPDFFVFRSSSNNFFRRVSLGFNYRFQVTTASYGLDASESCYVVSFSLSLSLSLIPVRVIMSFLCTLIRAPWLYRTIFKVRERVAGSNNGRAEVVTPGCGPDVFCSAASTSAISIRCLLRSNVETVSTSNVQVMSMTVILLSSVYFHFGPWNNSRSLRVFLITF